MNHCMNPTTAPATAPRITSGPPTVSVPKRDTATARPEASPPPVAAIHEAFTPIACRRMSHCAAPMTAPAIAPPIAALTGPIDLATAIAAAPPMGKARMVSNHLSQKPIDGGLTLIAPPPQLQ